MTPQVNATSSEQDRFIPGPNPAQDCDLSDGGLLDTLEKLALRWRLLTLAPLVSGAMALGGSYLIDPTYTAVTVLLPPQQQQSSAASALASLGALSGLAGGLSGGIKSPGDQYVALLQSANVENQIIDKFDLLRVYEVKLRSFARKTLQQNARVSLGKKDGLISIEVDSKSPQMAADMANQYVVELRRLTGELSLTEAQQRRAFFGKELQRTRDNLALAQKGLQGSGFDAGSLKAEPRAAAESYARVKAEATAAEIRLQVMRRTLVDNAPELQQQLALASALRQQVRNLEATTGDASSDYTGRYREYKYQDTLFEIFSKQYELARLDESREGALIQVIDPATPPDRKSKPSRSTMAIGTTLAVFVGLVLCLFLIDSFKQLGEARRRRAG
jgi:uncharacterized protein involved in exopolysaccharide biosynthesis